jgi:carbamoyl-phosphate synthase large subunit
MIDFKSYLAGKGKLVATDNWSVAPALFLADKQYMVPKITDENYMSEVVNICKKENIKAITTFIDPEIELLSNNRELLKGMGILPLCPSAESANICFD